MGGGNPKLVHHQNRFLIHAADPVYKRFVSFIQTIVGFSYRKQHLHSAFQLSKRKEVHTWCCDFFDKDRTSRWCSHWDEEGGACLPSVISPINSEPKEFMQHSTGPLRIAMWHYYKRKWSIAPRISHIGWIFCLPSPRQNLFVAKNILFFYMWRIVPFSFQHTNISTSLLKLMLV